MPLTENTGNLVPRFTEWLIIGLAVLMAFLWLAPPLRFLQGADIMPLWLHISAEVFSTVIAMLIFGVGWNAYSKDRSGNIVILSCAFLAVGLIDFAHTLSFNGMPDFVTPAGKEKAINFWLSARLVAALALFAVAMRSWKPLTHIATRYVLLAGSLAITALVYWLGLFHPSLWPSTFIEGQGLTPFKIGVEYAIIAILFVPALLFFRRTRKTHALEATHLYAAATISILSELCFTLYSDVSDAFNLLGHIYKVVAYSFLYRAIFTSSVREPFRKMHQEVAERRRAEDALRQSEVKLRTLFESTSDAVMLLDENGFFDCNRATLAMFGCATKKEFCSRHPSDLSPRVQPCGTDSAMLANQRIAYAMEKGRDFFEWLHQRTDTGMDFPAEVLLNRMEVGGKMVLQATVRDITARKNTEAELHLHREHLEERVIERTQQLDTANKELEAFSYSVSHDLRAPLRSIDGFSQVLLKAYGAQLDAKGQDYLERVRRASQRMGELIDDMLSLSRVTRSEIRKEPVDLTQLARNIAANLQESAPERQVKFIIADDIRVNADAKLLRIMLENLLGNAWKFTARQPVAKIELGVDEQSGIRALFVRDNGAGFNMDYAHKLFNPFQRLHGMNEFEGSGIGLATVHRIIQRHGGRIWANAQEGQGATFFFTCAKE